MNHFLLSLLFLSLSGGVMAFLVLLLRPLYQKKVTKRFSYLIWLLVLTRFILPFGFKISVPGVSILNTPSDKVSYVSVQNPNENLFSETTLDPSAAIQSSGKTTGDLTIDTAKPSSDLYQNGNTTKTAGDEFGQNSGRSTISFALSCLFPIWLCGALGCFCFNVISYLRFRRKLVSSFIMPVKEDIEVFHETCSSVKRSKAGKPDRTNFHIRKAPRFVYSKLNCSPMLVNFFHPIIVLPEQMQSNHYSSTELSRVLLHELIHQKRSDVFIKWIVMAVSCIHWFNPFIYLVRREIEHSCELSCDEAVLKQLNEQERMDYGKLLLKLTAERQSLLPYLPAAFSKKKNQLKDRVKGICEYQKTSRTTIVFTLIFGLFLVGCSAGRLSPIGGETPTSVENESEIYASGIPSSTDANAETDYYVSQEKEVSATVELAVSSNPSKNELNAEKKIPSQERFLKFYRELNGEEYEDNKYKDNWREDFDFNEDGKIDILSKFIATKYGISSAELHFTHNDTRLDRYLPNLLSTVSFEINDLNAVLTLTNGLSVTVSLPEISELPPRDVLEIVYEEDIFVRPYWTEVTFCKWEGRNAIRIKEVVCYKSFSIEIAEISTYFELENYHFIRTGQEIVALPESFE